MIEIVEFKREHMEYLIDFQKPDYQAYFTNQVLDLLVSSKATFTAMKDGHEVLVSGGVRETWKNRGELWAVFTNVPGMYTAELHKAIKGFVENYEIKRMEMVVYKTNTFGHKLARALGFKLETETMAAFTPDGQDASMYVRVK